MSLWKRVEIWYYDFWFHGRRYSASTLVTVSRTRAIRKDIRTDGGRPTDSAVHEPDVCSR